MELTNGIYEALITQLLREKLDALPKDDYFIKSEKVDKEEAALFISRHLAAVINQSLLTLKGEDRLQKQIKVANQIIALLQDEIQKINLQDDLIEAEGEILEAVFSKLDREIPSLKEQMPYSRLTHSELFTGGSAGISLGSELKKEIMSADRIDLLVSFIKFKGIIILHNELKNFTEKGGKLRVLTTTYMGATDQKAITLLAALPNTKVKISYNTSNERLHAKAYLFYRNTGFHTAYIGSSNFSRSALTDGLEWNLKITTKEVGHVIDKFQKTFDSYWESTDFEWFDNNNELHHQNLKEALHQKAKKTEETEISYFFDIKPRPFQKEILEKLEVERKVHRRYKNLVVAATGTGKTIISAFDYLRFKNKKENKTARLLFIAHRKEILEQSLKAFRGILKDENFGELWLADKEPYQKSHLFASVQTLHNRLKKKIQLSPDYFDFIVIDECHHISADSYRGIVQYFRPKVMLGLTATPERMDNINILDDFNHRIAAEIRLPEAMNMKLLCPFHYFGVSDSIDLSMVTWESGRYKTNELTNVYTANDRRVGDIIRALHTYTKDPHEVRALAFCVSIEHVEFMVHKFQQAGFKAAGLSSANANKERDLLNNQLKNREINYLFVVDIFNEGVDIPEIDTILFLRPTESLTIFLQQLGRGLRLIEGKEVVTVLDFVGNARAEYDFEHKFRALIGKTGTPVSREIEDNFPHLPLGCSIVLEKVARDIILQNIRNATKYSRRQLIQKIRNFTHVSTLPLTLGNFISHYQMPLPFIFKTNSWKRLCFEAGVIEDFSNTNEKEILSAIQNKWLAMRSFSYFSFLLNLANQGFQVNVAACTEEEKGMLLMLHFDVWQDKKKFATLEASIRAIGDNPVLVEEIKELLEYLIDKIDFRELDIKLPYPQPLKVHARYTRDQILAAFGLSTFEKKSTNREGVAENKALQTEILFINLHKSEKDFSPTTMYDDYALSERIFHWQSQNTTGPDTPAGKSYIQHRKTGKKILLFAREKNEDEYGKTMAYVFLGEGTYLEHYGAKPMSIHWHLLTPLPSFMWKEAVKMRVG